MLAVDARLPPMFLQIVRAVIARELTVREGALRFAQKTDCKPFAERYSANASRDSRATSRVTA